MIIVLAILTGCNGLKIGVGLRGELVGVDTILLDGDTFAIRDRITDSLFVVRDCANSDDRTQFYLLKYECNGFYYPQVGATSVVTIDNTTNYVGINDDDVYDIKAKRVLFSSPCSVSDLYYLGK